VRRAPLLFVAILTAAGLALACARIERHARSELTAVGEPRGLAEIMAAPSPALLEATLAPGQEVVFELCSADGFPEARWLDAARFEVWYRDAGERILEAPLDAARLARARRRPGLGCVELAHAASLGVGGRYAIALGGAASAPLDVPIRARIVASRPMASIDLLALLVLTLAGLGWVAVLAGRARRAPIDVAIPARGSRPEARAALAFGLLFVSLFAVGFVPVRGPMAAVVGGALLAAVQLACALGLAAPGEPADRPRGLALGLQGRRALAALALAPFAGVALVLLGRLLSALVPSTAEAPIETFVASHGGYLAVAVGGVLLPIVEELFFRGLLYGLVERAYGANAATALIVLAFPLLHLPQVLGAWGALASLALTGAAMTLLRRASGSVAPSALAHLVHNALVALLGFPV
jgi:membrane protease YdiL (CAAX protease family)